MATSRSTEVAPSIRSRTAPPTSHAGASPSSAGNRRSAPGSPRILRPRSSTPETLDAWQAHRDARLAQLLLGLGDRVRAVVEDRRGEHSVGAALVDRLDQVVERARATRGDHWDVDRISNTACQLQLVAVLGAVAVHA